MCNLEKGDHLCLKNWTGSSTSMETDIIVEAFTRSIEIHGIRYTSLVGDGDSSVTKKLQTVKPCGNVPIQKIECSNHLLRNYSNNLKQLPSKRYSSKGLEVPIFLRQLLKNNLQRLRVAVECAVKHRRQENVPFQNQSESLKKDIENSICHVFGEHSRCDTYFCHGTKDNEKNFIPEMKTCGLYNDILSFANRLIYNSRSLLKNMTNNMAECYNSVVAKFIGGKRVDYSKRGSYFTRCHAAGISFNEGPKYHSILQKAITGKSPGKYTKSFVQKKERKLISCRKRLTYLKINRRKKNAEKSREDKTKSRKF